MTDHCDCPSEGESSAAIPRCGAEREFESRHPGETYRQVCSRPEGHDGPHAACTVSEHPAEVWEADR